MKYRTAICASTVLMSIAPAWAQQGGSNVTIYGQIDLGVEYINNVSKPANGTGKSPRLSSGTGTSYWGLRGNEDLGRGLKAVWNLEAGFAPDTGASLQGGRFFGRQSYLGLQGGFGTITVGRQYNVRFLAWRDLNPFGAGSHGLTTLDEGYTGTARADNSIRYLVRVGGFDAGVNYSFGRDAVRGTSVVASNCPGEATDSKQCREWAAMLKYDGKSWGVSSAYERAHGGTSATFGGLTSPDLTDSRFVLGGYLKVDRAKFGLGWVKRDNEGIATPKSNLVWLTGTVPVTESVSIDGMLAQLKYEDSPNKAQVVVLRGVRSLSKRTALYVTAEHINNSGTLALGASTSSPKVAPSPGGSQLSVITGIRHRF